MSPKKKGSATSIFSTFISMRDRLHENESLGLNEFVERRYQDLKWSDDFVKADLACLQSQQITSVNILKDSIQLGYGYQVVSPGVYSDHIDRTTMHCY